MSINVARWSQWRQPAGEERRQSSQDQRKNTRPQGKWRGISAEVDAVGTTVKEKTSTWTQSCKESEKRDRELYKMIEHAAIDERQEHKERNMIKDLLRELQKKKGRGR